MIGPVLSSHIAATPRCALCGSESLVGPRGQRIHKRIFVREDGTIRHVAFFHKFVTATGGS